MKSFRTQHKNSLPVQMDTVIIRYTNFMQGGEKNEFGDWFP